jgi:magnesium transporter
MSQVESQLHQLITHSHEEVLGLLTDANMTSIFEDYEDFKVLVVRRIIFLDSRMKILPESFLIVDERVYFFNESKDTLQQLKGGFQGLLLKLEKFYNNNQKILANYTSGVEKLEDYLFERSTPSYFMDLWFDLKRDLSKIDNYYYRNGLVYREFFKNCENMFGKLTDEFKDIEEGIQFHRSNLEAMMGRLDGVYSYYDSVKADRLNKTLLSLTVISGIFLPLNLIVGFFGMNTPGLPFLNDPKGTQNVLAILGGVLLVCMVGLQIIHLIDRYLLRYILGRYDFYKNIQTQIEDFGNRIRGK